MNILYDGHIFRWQRTGGISCYFHEIISRLPADWQPTVLGIEARNGNLPAHPRLAVARLSSIRPRRFTQPLTKTRWKALELRKAGVFHPTYYNLTGGLSYCDVKCPVVITVHDLIARRYPQLEPDSDATIRDQKAAIDRADHVICVSAATESDVLEFFPAARGKTTVIHHGSSFAVYRGSQDVRVFETPTFLCVGRRATYKNFLFLLRAFARACSSHPRLRLHVAGPPLSVEERWFIHLLGISDRVDSSIYPAEDELRELYINSVALLYPSYHEGFGIPPLEAMACGHNPHYIECNQSARGDGRCRPDA